jgi:hypothetical protein
LTRLWAIDEIDKIDKVEKAGKRFRFQVSGEREEFHAKLAKDGRDSPISFSPLCICNELDR